MSSTTSSLTTPVDTFKFSPFMSPWRRTSCPVMPPRHGRINLKHFMMEQRPLLALKYPFLTPQQIKRKGKELWCKLSAKDKKANIAAPSMRLPTPPQNRVCEEMGKRHFPFHFPQDEPLSMFSSPPAPASRKSLPAFPSAADGHQGAVKSQSFRRTNGIVNSNKDLLQFRRPLPEKTYADGCRWPCKAPPVIEHAECQQSGILKRSQNARKTAGDRRVSFAGANCCSPDGATISCNHDNDLQTNNQHVENSADNKRKRLKALDNDVNRRMSLDVNIKQPIDQDTNHDSSAERKMKQLDWSKINTTLKIEDGEGSNSDSDAEREFQLASLHRATQPVLPHGGFVKNKKRKPRRKSCDEGMMSKKKRKCGKKERQVGRKAKEVWEDPLDSRGDEKHGNKVQCVDGDQPMTNRKTTYQETIMSYQNDKKYTSHANVKQHVTNGLTVYDMFDDDDDELIDFSRTKFSDYRENVKDSVQTTRRRTMACVGSGRQMFMREDDSMKHGPCRADRIAAKYGKFLEYQHRNAPVPRQAKMGDRHVSGSTSSPSCYNLRSQKVDEMDQVSHDRHKDQKWVRGKVTSPKSSREFPHGRGRKQGVGSGNTNYKSVHVAPPGVIVQNQEQLMTPETTEEIIIATLTNIICAPRKLRPSDNDTPGGEKLKSQAKGFEGSLLIGKKMVGGDSEYRMDRVRKRLVESVPSEQMFQRKKQEIGDENTELVSNGKPYKAATRTGRHGNSMTTQMAVPRQRPCTRSSVGAHSSLSLRDAEGGTQVAWQSAIATSEEEHDGMSHRRTAATKRDHMSSVSSEIQNGRSLLRTDDGVTITRSFKVGNDLEEENHQPVCLSETGRPREARKIHASSPLLVNQNLTNQIPLIPTTALSFPVNCSRQSDASSIQNQDVSGSDSTSPFPYVSPLPPSSASSGVGASFWSFLSLSQQAKHLQNDLENVMSSSDDEIPATHGSVKNDVLTRAVRSMQQLTAPPGGVYSPRRSTVVSPSVSGISELSQLSSLFVSVLQTTSPEPTELRETQGAGVDGKTSHRKLRSTTAPRDDSGMGTSAMRKRTRKTTKTELQKALPPKVEPPKVGPPKMESPSVKRPNVKPPTHGSLCDLFDDVRPDNKQLYNRRVVASLPTATSNNFHELFSQGERDIFL